MRARRVADTLGAEGVATILKRFLSPLYQNVCFYANAGFLLLNRRAQANVIESMQIVGSVEGKYCIIVDDIIDTAGTLAKVRYIFFKENKSIINQFHSGRTAAC